MHAIKRQIRFFFIITVENRSELENNIENRLVKIIFERVKYSFKKTMNEYPVGYEYLFFCL